MASQAIANYKSALPDQIGPRMAVSALVSAALSVAMLSSAKVALLSAALSATATLIEALVSPFFSSFLQSKNNLFYYAGLGIRTICVGLALGGLKYTATRALGIPFLETNKAPNGIRWMAMIFLNMDNFRCNYKVPNIYVL